MNNLELKVVFAAVDKFVRPVKAITGAATEAAKALRDNTARIKELNRSVEQIDAFKKAEKDAAITANTFAKTRRQIDELNAAISRTGVPTRAQSAELATLTRRSEDLRQKHKSLTETEQKLFERLKAAGIDTRNLAEARRQLASASGQASTESRRLQANLDAENQKMRRLRAAQADLAKAKSTAGKLAMAGAGITAAGAAVGLPAARAVNDFRDFETAMLGVARQMDGARDASGKLTADYWDMAAAIKAMSERLPGTANDIAKIVEGGARMGIQGKQNLLIYAETTSIMANAFDLPVDQVGEDIGKISQLYKVPIQDIKELGDTINWLDDNALSKGGDIIDVMKRIAGTADMSKMSYREAAALGSTFLSLGAGAEVAASASNAMVRELAVANMQSKRFREGLGMLGLDGKAVQAGMANNATGTIIMVLEKIKALAGDKQLEAATRLFGKEFGDDAAKLASNLEEYRRQLALVRDEAAKGSMDREFSARADTLNQRIENAQDSIRNLSSDLGQHLKPAIADTLESTQSIIQGIRDWAAENPRLSAGIITGVKWLAILLTVLGAITIAAGAILVPLAMLKFSLAAIGLSGSAGKAGLAGIASKIWLVLGPITKLTAAFGAGYAAGTLLNAGIDTLLSKILGYETTLGGSIYDLEQRIRGGFGNAVTWLETLPLRAVTVGSELVNGMIRGIQARWDALRSTVTGMADSTIGWVKEKLGIRSPSRVFAEIGAFTMQGFERGILQNDTGPLNALGGVARQLAGIGSAAALSMSPIGIGSAAAAGGNTYHISIQAPAGADEQLLASLVIRAIEQADARKAAARRSRLTDSE
ncbi:phage tail tape measure protein [Azonexus sp. R2A61]|uniref:phage tail tape measure protein n=1 Tax=Azonexus sp. R2A61 TaxID=2744443 RepID=UPI0026466EA5|nr:phage tail tape measure protein [Azonexus sp. R2A61]